MTESQVGIGLLYCINCKLIVVTTAHTKPLTADNSIKCFVQKVFQKLPGINRKLTMRATIAVRSARVSI